MTWTEPAPITWKGYWPDDTPEDRAEREPWETYELLALGREAGDMRAVTLDDLRDVFKQHPEFPMRLIPDNAETVELYEQGYADGESNREADYELALHETAGLPDDVPTTPHAFADWLNAHWLVRDLADGETP